METKITPDNNDNDNDNDNNHTIDREMVKSGSELSKETFAGVHGEFGLESTKAPFIRIIQKVGQASVDFPSEMGSLLYGAGSIVPQRTVISFYGLQGKYQANWAFDTKRQERPPVFDTIAEAEAAGYNTRSFVKPGVDEMNVIPIALAFCILEVPNFGKTKSWAADLETSIPFGEGKAKMLLAPACWNLRSTQYRQVVPLLRTMASHADHDGKPMCAARYEITTKLSQIGGAGGNAVYLPILKRLPENNAASFFTLAKEIFG